MEAIARKSLAVWAATTTTTSVVTARRSCRSLPIARVVRAKMETLRLNEDPLAKAPSWKGSTPKGDLGSIGSDMFGALRPVSKVFRRADDLRSRTSSSTRSEASASSIDEYDYDFISIGGGSGGVRASRMAASFGAKVALVELPFSRVATDTQGGLGGTCVLRGCVPKKLLMFGSEFSLVFKDSAGFGWNIEGAPTFDWKTLKANKDKELDRLNGVYGNLLKNSGVDVLEGRGTLVDDHTVEIDGTTYTAKYILIATGGRTVSIPIPGAEYAIDSDKALDLPELPKRIAVVGGGYIAVEFAGIFNGMGSKVDLFYRKPLPLDGFDNEVRQFVTDEIAKKGVTLHPGHSPKEIKKLESGEYEFITDNGSYTVDAVMFALGRTPNTKFLNLDKVGVELDKKGAIVVNEFSQTTVPSIYAVGDVTNRINLTPVAIMEGSAVAKTLFAGAPTPADHSNVASAVFSQPPIGTVGLSEEQAIKEYGDVDVYASSFRPMKFTISGREERSLMKVVVDPKSDKVLGFHMVGPDAGEIMQGLAVAIKFGLTKAQLDTVVGIHPTAAEEFVTLRNVTRKIRAEEKEKVAA